MEPRYSSTAWVGFELAFRPWMRRRLDGVHIRGLEEAFVPPDLPVLVVSNHVSWWDGFLIRELHRRLRPDEPLYTVMAASELAKRPLFRWLGAIPLTPSATGARALLRELRGRLAAHPAAMIGYFPQGRIWPSHRRPLGFQRGAAWLAGRLAPVAVLPAALHVQPLTRPAPAAFVAVGRPFVARIRADPHRLETEVATLADDILDHIARYGEDAVAGWAGEEGS